MIIYTLINHPARRALGISEAEYCLLDLVYKYSTNPNGLVKGWCYASKLEIAREREMSESGVYKMVRRLQALALLQSQPQTGYLRTTQKWYKAVVVAAETPEIEGTLCTVEGGTLCTEGVHFVQSGGALCTVEGVHFVPPRDVQSVPYKSKDKSKGIRVIDKLSHTPASEGEAAAVEAEKKSDGPGFEAFEEIFEEKKFGAAAVSAAAPTDGSGAAMLAAVADAQAWCAAHPDQERQWRDIAKWRDDLAGPIAGFFSHWWGENGTQHRCRTHPQDFFQTRFLKWLQGEARIQQRNTNQQNHGHSTARGGLSANRKPARANGAEDAFNPSAVADVLRERHGIEVDFPRG